MNKEEISDSIKDVAERLADQLPNELMVRILAAKLNESLSYLSTTWGPNNVVTIVERAVEKKVEELLISGEFASRITEIAMRLANEALVIAKQDVLVKRKNVRGH